VTDKQAEMWAAFEAHKPTPAYADAWRVMCKERTYGAARAAYWAAPEESAAAWAARWARWAVDAAEEPTGAAASADEYAQKAIDALREVKP
jgi:hypothetical protein